jgi:hypothetical protein
MKIVPYAGNMYSGNIALVVDKDSNDNYMLVGHRMEPIGGRQIDEYIYMAQAYMYADAEKTIDNNEYDIFTVDLFGYKDLFFEVDGKLYDAFANWHPLLTALLENAMDDCIIGETCRYNVLSAVNGCFMDVYLMRKLSHNVLFQQNHLMSARLVNLAFPKSYNVKKFYTRTGSLTRYDSNAQHLSKLQVAFNAATYTMTDFKYIQLPVGQRCTLRNRDDLKVSIICKDKYGMYNRTLCVDADVNELYKYDAYFSVSLVEDRVVLDFMFNPNREYLITSNTTMSERAVLPANTLQIISTDMLSHAQAANMTYYEQYILQNTDDNAKTVTLPAVFKTIVVDELPISSWHTANYDYDVYKVASTGQWTGFNYLFTPVQTNDTKYDKSMFANASIAYPYGNLHTFIIECDKVRNQSKAYYNLHSYGHIDDSNLDEMFSKVSLPIVNKGNVTFRNISYRLYHNGIVSNDFDGKRFAVVLHPMTAEECKEYDINPYETSVRIANAKLVWSANYVVIVCDVNLKAWLSTRGKTSYENLTIQDFYDAQIGDLLPANLARVITQFMQTSYSVQANANMQEVALEPPFA